MKCEPSAYSIEDLERDGKTSWEGVRNFQARNFMKEMQLGDEVLFYASNADPSGVSGVAKISKAAYADPFQFKKGHKYEDPDSDPNDPRWVSVELSFVSRFPEVISLDELRRMKGLENMVVLRKGNRLSVMPVTKEEFAIVTRRGK